MRNLLSAGLVRLARCKVLWLSCAVMAVMEAVVTLSRYRDGVEYRLFHNIDGGFFLFAALVGFFSALVCAFFIGPEHGDGAMRNKIVTGHKRRDVYLSNLLLSCLASLILCAAAILPGLALGLPLLGGFQMGAARAALMTLGACLLSLAYAALFTLIAMLVPHRAAALAAAMVLALVLLAVGSYLFNRLKAPPTLSGYELSVNGQLVDAAPQPNPDYVPEGPVRDVFTFLNDFLPGGQAGQYLTASAQRPEVLMACDGVIFAASTAAGLVLFRRKDLK